MSQRISRQNARRQQRRAGGISLDEEQFAWDAYAQVAPGGHFLGSQHTRRHDQMAFYQHKIFVMDNYKKWEAEDSRDSLSRAELGDSVACRRQEIQASYSR
ncbi:MAG: trimethylamine methyltransferase family protein [Caldilineaceae bacterium]|nr:trimethylamine methyltransferase family protein [Caldilineaceae bacterium]